MLVLSRKSEQVIRLTVPPEAVQDGAIEITIQVVRLLQTNVRLGIEAPVAVAIVRDELVEQSEVVSV